MTFTKTAVFFLLIAIIYHILAVVYFEPMIDYGVNTHTGKGELIPLFNVLGILGLTCFAIISFIKKKNYVLLSSGIVLIAVLVYWLGRFSDLECAQCAAS